MPSIRLLFSLALLFAPVKVCAGGIPVTADGPVPESFDTSQIASLLTENGAKFLLLTDTWPQIQTAPGQYDLQDTIDNPMTQIFPDYSFNNAGLMLNMIDSNVAAMPSGLQNDSFSNPTVREDFLGTLRAIADDPKSKGIKYILLGNEVDQYLTENPNQLSGFMTLLNASIKQIHQEMPGVAVGTVVTSNAVNNPQLFDTIEQYSDFIDYTYYPFVDSKMESMPQVTADLNQMAAAAGKKPFAFTEIGYSSSPVVGSSQQIQADFVNTVFDTLDQYSNRVAFVSWSSLADPSAGDCQSYASEQDFSATMDFCAFFDNLGLRTDDNHAKLAWSAFVNDINGSAGAPIPFPEPSTWALLALGFAGLGIAGHTRRGRRTSGLGRGLDPDGGLINWLSMD